MKENSGRVLKQSDAPEVCDWMVRAYDEYDEIIAHWFIKNRTEKEALAEAEADIQKLGDKVDDWSIGASYSLATPEQKAESRWRNNSIQFPRLIAEILATQENINFFDLAESMDLTLAEVDELFDRANDEWERIKEDLL